LPSSASELVPGVEGVQRFDVELEGGDRLVTLEVPPHGDGAKLETGWVVHLFHGLTGSTSSGYVRRAAARLAGVGHTVVAVNHRGAGLGRGLARGMYHSGVAGDVRAALRAGRARHPTRRHLAIGYSLSGNALLLALGRDCALDPAAMPDAAIAVNPPVDLANCVKRIELPRNRLYDLKFVHGCMRAFDERVALGLLPAQPRLGLRHTLRDFDEQFTAPFAGFEGADDYYERCSARPWLASVRTPTFLMTSGDDPLIDWRDAGEAPRSSSVHVHVVRHGGHMGYLDRAKPVRGQRWLEDALLAALPLVGVG